MASKKKIIDELSRYAHDFLRDLLVPDVLCVEADGRLHGEQGEYLEEVILHDVPDYAIAVEVAAGGEGVGLFLWSDWNPKKKKKKKSEE